MAPRKIRISDPRIQSVETIIYVWADDAGEMIRSARFAILVTLDR